LFVDASGNVGVGTNPSAPFDLYGIANSLCLRIDGGAGVSDRAFKISNSTNSLIWDINSQGGSINAGILTFSTNSTERARIDSSGRLLVGTSSDSGGALLQVNGNRVRVATAKTPASASDTGTTGEICWDANYVYVCTATNTWKRSAISTW
jgi:hypothetical protein